MNRRDFVLTALGASGTVAAGGAYVLDVGPGSTDDAPDDQETNGTSTATATDSPPGSPTQSETATATESTSATPTDSTTDTPSATTTEASSATRTEMNSATPTETRSQTGTETPRASSTPTPEPRDGIEVEGTSQSGDDTRVAVKLTNTNEYAVYVEARVTWQFEGGGTDSETRSGIIAPSGSDTRQYSTDQQGTVTEWNVTLPTVQRI